MKNTETLVNNKIVNAKIGYTLHHSISAWLSSLLKTSSLRQPIRLPLLLAVIAMTLWTVLRLVLLENVGLDKLSLSETVATFSIGLWFDVWTLAYLITPFLLISAVMGNRLRSHRFAHAARWVCVFVVTFSLLFGVVSEFVFWQEFTTRFNFIAVDYLIYTHEVIGNICESYPVPLILCAIAVISAGISWFISRKKVFDVKPHSWKTRARLLLAVIVLPVISYLAANIDQMHVGSNSYAAELSGNGLFSLAAAMRRNELDYQRFYSTIPQTTADDILISQGVNRPPLDPHSHFVLAETSPAKHLGPLTRAPKNIVVIMVESLSADYVGAYGSTQGLTPNLDAIAQQGLKFENIYATGTRTVRGLEAVSLGTPPIPGQAIIHRPENDHLSTVGELLKAKGIAPYFIYGGYGYFDNMNGYFGANDYRIVDRTDFDKSTIAAENVWGVADESLFNNTLNSFDEAAKKQQPFFAHIMTTSNHRPFTFPDGRVDLPQGGRLGAVKYTDYAIGKFLKDAQAKPWFKDTLFIIVADHCSSVAGKTKLPVEKYRIPLIFYAPDMLKPGVEKRMASQMDIAPTIAGMMGADGDHSFFGESLFATHKNPPRAFISNYEELGYYKNDTLIVLSPRKKSEAYRINPATYEAVKTIMDKQLLQEAIAYYQTASSAFKQGAMKLTWAKQHEKS